MWFLKGINIFTTLPDFLIESLLKNAETISVHKGKYLRPKPEAMSKVWILKNGFVNLSKKTEDLKEIILADLGQGEVFGFFASGTENIKKLLYSNEDCTCYIIPPEDIRSIISNKAQNTFTQVININGISITLQRNLNELMFKDNMSTVMDAVKILADNLGVKSSNRIILKSTRLVDDIAKISFKSLTVVMLCLSVASKKGIIDLYSDMIVIRDAGNVG
ncbi:MAG TPA: cyclic nucleotide-binding domain-containing protein [bacterium]